MNSLVSIIIPVYKVEDLLERCVNSILTQTYKNIEIILVDDGSPDRCGELCNQYALKDERVKVVHKKNGGLSDARNAGIKIANGEFITFIDSDDWVSEDYVRVLHDLLISRGADISVCNFIRTSTETTIERSEKQDVIHEFSNIQTLENLCGSFYQQLTVSWGKLYRISLFENIEFPVGKVHEDEFTTYKLLFKANKVVVTSRALLYYWQRPDSIMGTGFKIKNRLHAIEAFEERVDFFDSIEQKDLKYRTLRALFGIYRNVNDNINLFEDEADINVFLRNFKRHVLALEDSKQSLCFTIYYKMYLRFPSITNHIYNSFKSSSLGKN